MSPSPAILPLLIGPPPSLRSRYPLGEWLTRIMSLALVITCFFACDRPSDIAKRTPKKSKPATLLEPKALGEALNALTDPLPNPIRILSMKALPSQVILQVQDPKDPTEVVEYRFRDGKVNGPARVTLLGSGKLQDNLFPIQAANPQAASEVLRAVHNEYGGKQLRMKKLVMVRNLPRSRDIQFRVYLDSPNGLLLIKADKVGRLLGEPEPVPEPLH